jgi:predicted DNA-binding protein
MSITIDLPNEVYERLEKQAQARGTTIAEAVAQVLEEAEANRRAAFFERLRAEGRILSKKPLADEQRQSFKRIDVQGKPVSECLIEERR